MTATAYAPDRVHVCTTTVPEARIRNRAAHYWPRIEAANGRKKEREARDYLAALLANQPPDLIERAVEAVEAVVGVTYERK